MPICENCNSVINEKENICPFCGHKIKAELKGEQDQPKFTAQEKEIVIEKAKPQSAGMHESAIDLSDNIILISPDTEELELQEAQQQTVPPNIEILPERNYWMWFLLGIVTFGIGFLIYLYVNIEDLEKHSIYPLEFRAEKIEISASSILLLFIVSICFLFIPILWYVYYKKYASLYYHLKDQKKDTAPYKLVHPGYYISIIIITNLLALVHPIIYTFTEIDIQMSLPVVFWIIVGLVFVFTIPTFLLDYLWQRAYNAHVKIAMMNLNVYPEKD